MSKLKKSYTLKLAFFMTGALPSLLVGAQRTRMLLQKITPQCNSTQQTMSSFGLATRTAVGLGIGGTAGAGVGFFTVLNGIIILRNDHPLEFDDKTIDMVGQLTDASIIGGMLVGGNIGMAVTKVPRPMRSMALLGAIMGLGIREVYLTKIIASGTASNPPAPVQE